MLEQRDQLFDRMVGTLAAQGLSSAWYVVPSFEGYKTLTDGATDVYCLEVCLGEAQDKPDYDTYAVAQTFTSKYPNLALVFLTDIRRSDRKPSPTPAKFSVEVDRQFSCTFLPLMFTAFNSFDPTGQQRGLLVQSYHSEMALADLIQASGYTVKLLMRFKQDGQLAIIAVDYNDALIKSIANFISFVTLPLKSNIFHIPKTREQSVLQVPIRNMEGGHYLITDYSSALDQGFRLACSILDKHYELAAHRSTG